MAGGTWTTQNKARPGVYINFTGVGPVAPEAGERGVAAFALSLPWGPSKQVLTINAGDDVSTLLGYDLTAPELLPVKEALKRARTLLLYRLNTGTKAAVTTGNLTATAKHGGTRGNALSVAIQANVDNPSLWDVTVTLGGTVKHKQTAANIAGLTNNDWIDYSGTGSLAATAGAPLVDGADGSTVNQDHVDFLAALELLDFNTVAYPGTAADLKAVYSAFVKRLRDDEGKKVQGVLASYTTADHEGIVSVKNGVVLADGASLTADKAVAWVAGATAAATVAESLTYAAYDDAVDANPRYTPSAIEAALNAGEFLFTAGAGRAYVEQDINTLTSFTTDKPKAFRKNRVIRVLDGIANDIKRIFETSYLGKVNNNADGRGLFQGAITTYLSVLQAANAIQNFNSQTDVAVSAGIDSDSIYVEADIQPVDSVEKIYIRVSVG